MEQKRRPTQRHFQRIRMRGQSCAGTKVLSKLSLLALACDAPGLTPLSAIELQHQHACILMYARLIEPLQDQSDATNTALSPSTMLHCFNSLKRLTRSYYLLLSLDRGGNDVPSCKAISRYEHAAVVPRVPDDPHPHPLQPQSIRESGENKGL